MGSASSRCPGGLTSAVGATGELASGSAASAGPAGGAIASEPAAIAPVSNCGLLDRLALDLVALPLAAALPASVPPPGTMIGLVVGGTLGALVLGNERLPVGDRDLVIVGMYFAEGEKTVPVAAVIDESRLQRRLYARDLGQIDVATKLFTVR